MNKDVFPNILIIKHPSGNGFFAYDILCKNNFCSLVDSNQGYKLNCRYVEKVIKDNPKDVYLFSDDDGHISSFNWIVDYVKDLISKGARFIEMDEGDINKLSQTSEKTSGVNG